MSLGAPYLCCNGRIRCGRRPQEVPTSERSTLFRWMQAMDTELSSEVPNRASISPPISYRQTARRIFIFLTCSISAAARLHIKASGSRSSAGYFPAPALDRARLPSPAGLRKHMPGIVSRNSQCSCNPGKGRQTPKVFES